MLLAAIEKQVVQANDAPWQERLHHLLRLTVGIDAPELQYYDARMLALEHQIAEPKHHRRVHDEIVGAWSKALNMCADLPHPPSALTVKTLCLSAFGGRRYVLLVHADDDATARAWAAELERQCQLVLSVPSRA
jgi:hypothetical protein